MKINNHIRSIYQKKGLKITWSYLLITEETEKLVMGKPSNEDLNAGLVLQTFSKQNNSFQDDDEDEENSYLRKTFMQHYVLIKDFNKFMYNQTKHKERKHFCMYCLQCFSREDVLNEYKNNCISINGKQPQDPCKMSYGSCKLIGYQIWVYMTIHQFTFGNSSINRVVSKTADETTAVGMAGKSLPHCVGLIIFRALSDCNKGLFAAKTACRFAGEWIPISTNRRHNRA